jgi:hypothetical protein
MNSDHITRNNDEQRRCVMNEGVIYDVCLEAPSVIWTTRSRFMTVLLLLLLLLLLVLSIRGSSSGG